MAEPPIKLEQPLVIEDPAAPSCSSEPPTMAATPAPSSEDGVTPAQFQQQLSEQAAPVREDDTQQLDTQQLDVLGRPVQKLVQLIKELEQLGVETNNMPLPKIVVVGDQSAGKSSLIEGISGIKVPRSDGTCTRCPLQITLYSSEKGTSWSCNVSLQQKFSYLPDADIDGRYGKWRMDHTPTNIPFAVVTNKEDLEGIISRAQRATLNPGDDAIKYLNATCIDDMPLKVEFSPNKVILDITAPAQPSLSFIDLPGVIRQMTQSKDKWLVNLVENFVFDHIDQDNSLILLARSMESDFANSSGAALIDQCEGALERTVGCLTKPDRWPQGQKTQSIANVLNGDAFAVGHGYYVTKQPDQIELNAGVTADDARKKEEEFFAKTPWSAELNKFHDRFGTLKLRDHLSIKLTKQILITLPRITRKVNTRIEEIEAELVNYPCPPENALGRVIEALTVFKISVEKHAQGVHPHNEMRNSLKELANTFHASLQKLRPGLIVKTPDEFRKAHDVAVFSLLSDDEEDEATANASPCPTVEPKPQTKKRPASAAKLRTPTSKKRVKSDVALTDTPTSVAPGKKTFRLLEMRDTLGKLTASEVPGEVDPLAIDYLRKETLAGWEEPMVEFISGVNQELQATLHRLLEEACAQWLNTVFFKEAKKIVKTFVSRVMRDQLEFSKRALTLEQRKPLTFNADGFNFHHDRELKALQDGRITQRLVEKFESADNAAGRILVDNHERKKKAMTDLKARAALGEDPFDQEIKVMAKVRGYYGMALLCFLDHVVQGVQVEGLHELEHDLPQQLKAGLEVESKDAQERCKELLAEDREREIHRKNLQKEKLNFIEAQHKLARLGQIGDDVDAGMT